MTYQIDRPTIVLPVNAEDPEEIPPGLVELFHPHRLIILGYYMVPDQASPEQLREEFEAEATAAVEAIADRFESDDGSVESVVVFTRDRSETIDRIAAEYEADAVLTTGELGESLSRIFIPLRGDENLERIVGFVSDLVQGSESEVTLYNAAESDDAATTGEFLLRGACDRLEEEGLDSEQVNWQQERTDSVGKAIVAAAAEYDLLILGESKPSLRERILGHVGSRVIESTSHPVLIVRDV